MTGRTYLERGSLVTVVAGWHGPRPAVALPDVTTRAHGPRNVLIRRADGSLTVRPFRGLRRSP